MASQASLPFHILCKPIGPICNLECEYCFYLSKKNLYPRGNKWRMTDEVLETYTRQYIECQPPGTAEVNFAFQGGEPTLMGVDFFRRALEFQAKYKRPGMTISNALQTNGTLLDDEWGTFLHDNGFLVGISIDGTERIHNRFRLDRTGQGTWDKVMRGLDVLQRHKVEYNALVLTNSLNSCHPIEVYEFIKKKGVEFMQFIPLVELDHESGELTHRSVDPKQWGNFLNRVFDRWRDGDIGNIFVQHFDMMLGIVMGQPGTLCVHSPQCGRNVALEHNGDLYTCDHFVFPEYQLGNVMETPVNEMLDSDFQMTFGTDKKDKLPNYCRSCKFLNFCWGGCPGHRTDETPDGEPGLNHLCAGYKMFYSYSLPYFRAMAQALQMGRPASAYQQIMHANRNRAQAMASTRKVGRNDPCPCGSGKKFKKCCAN